MSDDRSFWAWGRADRFPDEAARKRLCEQLGSIGFSGLAPKPVPTVAGCRIPAGRIEVPDDLASFCTDDREARIRHAYGRAYPDVLRGFQGDFQRAPDLVALPRNEEDIGRVLRFAAAAGAAVVPYGGGTSVVAGVECRGDQHTSVITVDLQRMDRVLQVDTISLSARIQAGALGPVLEAQLAEHGLSLRHFPQSFEFSTLGGWIATRAGGHFATRYTHVDDLVQSVTMLTPTGPYETRRLPASGAGPDPARLVLGSEGILGIITEAWMRVFPRPRFRSSATVHFADWKAAVDAVRAISQARLEPSNCRLLDQREALLNAVAAGANVLLLGFESATFPQASRLEEALLLATENGGTVQGTPQHKDHGATDRSGGTGAWRQAFLDGPYLQSALVSCGAVADTFETCITWDRFPALHEEVLGVVTAAMQETCGTGSVSCRFTHVYPDGPAPYYTFLCVPPSGKELPTWRAIKLAASEVLSKHGATITHHHAVGRLHRPWYDRERPEAFARVLRAAKAELDPDAVLNPGVLVDSQR